MYCISKNKQIMSRYLLVRGMVKLYRQLNGIRSHECIVVHRKLQELAQYVESHLTMHRSEVSAIPL